MPNNNQMNGDQKTTNQGIALAYYFAFILEGAVLASLIMYLVMSNFNKKTLKETFSTKEKIVIDALSIIILTSGITYVSTKMINPSQNKMEMNQDSNNVSYSATKQINENSTITIGDYTSTNKDENALLISGSTTEISNITVNKTGDSDGGDSTSFYGNNSAILAKGGANLTLNNITVTTDATGANGIFSYGGSATTNNSSSDGTSITISDSSITTMKDNSGEIMTTGGGIMNASNLIIQTAIGNIVVDSISTLEMNLSKSYYEGTINGDNSAKEISLKLSKDSTIKLTGDSYITSLEDDDTSYSNIDFNGYKLYVNRTSIN